MTVLPGVSAVAMPIVLMVATVSFDDDHVANTVTSAVVRSVRTLVAVNPWISPLAICNGSGLMTMLVTAAGPTCTYAPPLTVPIVAVMVTLPVLMAVTLPVASTVATEVSDDDQVAMPE